MLNLTLKQNKKKQKKNKQTNKQTKTLERVRSKEVFVNRSLIDD